MIFKIILTFIGRFFRAGKIVTGRPVEIGTAEIAIVKQEFVDIRGKKTQRLYRVVRRFMKPNLLGEIMESDKPDGPYTVCEEIEDGA